MGEEYYDQPQQYTQRTQLNRTIPDSDVISLRLDTTTVITKMQMYLQGITETIKVEKGKLIKTVEKVGEARVNEVGIQVLMSKVESVVNSMTVQGNMKEDDYWRYITMFHQWLYRDLFVNMYEYGIKETQYDAIIDEIMSLVIPFMSRTIDNLERRSYGESLKQDVTSYPEKKRGGLFSMFGKI